MDSETLREIVLALGEASAKGAAEAWANDDRVLAAYFEGEAQRAFEIVAIIDSGL